MFKFFINTKSEKRSWQFKFLMLLTLIIIGCNGSNEAIEKSPTGGLKTIGDAIKKEIEIEKKFAAKHGTPLNWDKELRDTRILFTIDLQTAVMNTNEKPVVLRLTVEDIHKDKDKFFEIFGNYCDRIYVEELAPIWPSFDIEKRAGIKIDDNKGQYNNNVEQKDIPRLLAEKGIVDLEAMFSRGGLREHGQRLVMAGKTTAMFFVVDRPLIEDSESRVDGLDHFRRLEGLLGRIDRRRHR